MKNTGPGTIHLEDANGTLYLAEPAGVWEPAEIADGVTEAIVYFEGDHPPDDAIPLYRLTVLDQDQAEADQPEAAKDGAS